MEWHCGWFLNGADGYRYLPLKAVPLSVRVAVASSGRCSRGLGSRAIWILAVVN